jgi:hypothetical protein
VQREVHTLVEYLVSNVEEMERLTKSPSARVLKQPFMGSFVQAYSPLGARKKVAVPPPLPHHKKEDVASPHMKTETPKASSAEKHHGRPAVVPSL